DHAISQGDRVAVVSLRGRLSAFDVLDPVARAEWAHALRDLDAALVVLDCLRPVLDSLGLDEDRDAGRLLVALDELLEESGAREAVVVHHMGHGGERSRGSSRLRDWPDVEWRLVREDDEPGSPRYFGAYGRDVDQPEAELGYNSMTRRLSILGGSRQDAAAREHLPALLDVLRAEPDLSGRAIEQRLRAAGVPRNAGRAALKHAIAERLIRQYNGPTGGRLNRLSEVAHYP
ncbi:MAG: helicase RepA family protein, partial [Actinomycetia bacterium]|nr:helicase RepA family protein [Actinomycetes bacterium]